MECLICRGLCIKKGIRNGVQKYQCKSCRKYFQGMYSYGKCTREKEKMIIQLHNEGCGVSSIARITCLSKATIVRKIELLSEQLEFSEIKEEGQTYEVDELRTYVGNKKNQCWVMFVLNRKTKKVLFHFVGRRTKINLLRIINPLLNLNPAKICTDGLNIYPSIIPKKIHRIKQRVTNSIERMNLNLRHFLKRLNRSTICYSKSEEMLKHCCRLFFYKQNEKPGILKT